MRKAIPETPDQIGADAVIENHAKNLGIDRAIKISKLAMRVGAPQANWLLQQAKPATVICIPLELTQTHPHNIGITPTARSPQKPLRKRRIIVKRNRSGRRLAFKPSSDMIQNPTVSKQQTLHLIVAIIIRSRYGIATRVNTRIGIGTALEQKLGNLILRVPSRMSQRLAPRIGFGLIVVKLISVVGIKPQIQQHTHHIEIVILHSNL